MPKHLTIYLPELAAKLYVMDNGMFAYKGREQLQEADEARASLLLSSLSSKVKLASKEEEAAAEETKKGTIFASSSPSPSISSELPPLVNRKLPQ